MMCVWSEKEGTDFSRVSDVMTFFHARGHTHRGPVSEKGHFKLYPDATLYSSG